MNKKIEFPIGLLSRARTWLGPDGVERFIYFKKNYGEVSPVIPGSDTPFNIPHTVHFAEGKQIRNFMRNQKECEEYLDRLDDIWIEFIESVIAPFLPEKINQSVPLGNQIHVLKTVAPFFDDVWNNRKEFEVRKNDRDFKVGDRLQLLESEPPPGQNPRFILKDIKYILPGGQYGIESGFVVLGLKEVTDQNRALRPSTVSTMHQFNKESKANDNHYQQNEKRQ